MKTITYRGEKIEKPDNISMNQVKQLIDIGDYSLTVKKVIEIFSMDNEVKGKEVIAYRSSQEQELYDLSKKYGIKAVSEALKRGAPGSNAFNMHFIKIDFAANKARKEKEEVHMVKMDLSESAKGIIDLNKKYGR